MTITVFSLPPGVSWPSLHLLAETVLLQEMKAGGLLVGEVDAMMEVRLGAIFMPCGMGHLLGLDIHDVGGFPKVGRLLYEITKLMYLCIVQQKGHSQSNKNGPCKN